MPFELRIALRYLVARRKQAFISLISAISVLGVTVGVMAVLVALALMTGLQTEIHSRILGTTAHVYIFRNVRESIVDYRGIIEKVRRLPGVTDAAPVIYGKGMLVGAGGSAFVTLKGIVPSMERRVTDLARQIEEGRLESLEESTGGVAPILLGRDLALTLGVELGDVVALIVPEGRLSPMGMLPSRVSFRAAGIVRTDLHEFDAEWAYLPLSQMQRLFEGGEDRAGQIEVRLKDVYAVNRASEAIMEALGPDYLTHDWSQLNRSLFTALWLEKIAIGITIGLIVMVAALNIVATLVLMVMEKHKDIAILVSMGASRGAITRIFMLQGTVIGAAGTIVGACAGWLLSGVLDHYRLIRVPADVYQVSYVPFTLTPRDAVIVIAAALITCFLATIYPAREAARLDPAEAIRYE
ncbi:MAG: ABC transporter permease [Vicinamibacteria bacterium]|nr:ABC transporter permease [Vicinamibacteria bacterium]